MHIYKNTQIYLMPVLTHSHRHMYPQTCVFTNTPSCTLIYPHTHILYLCEDSCLIRIRACWGSCCLAPGGSINCLLPPSWLAIPNVLHLQTSRKKGHRGDRWSCFLCRPGTCLARQGQGERAGGRGASTLNPLTLCFFLQPHFYPSYPWC